MGLEVPGSPTYEDLGGLKMSVTFSTFANSVQIEGAFDVLAVAKRLKAQAV